MNNKEIKLKWHLMRKEQKRKNYFRNDEKVWIKPYPAAEKELWEPGIIVNKVREGFYFVDTILLYSQIKHVYPEIEEGCIEKLVDFPIEDASKNERTRTRNN